MAVRNAPLHQSFGTERGRGIKLPVRDCPPAPATRRRRQTQRLEASRGSQRVTFVCSGQRTARRACVIPESAACAGCRRCRRAVGWCAQLSSCWHTVKMSILWGDSTHAPRSASARKPCRCKSAPTDPQRSHHTYCSSAPWSPSNTAGAAPCHGLQQAEERRRPSVRGEDCRVRHRRTNCRCGGRGGCPLPQKLRIRAGARMCRWLDDEGTDGSRGHRPCARRVAGPQATCTTLTH